MHREPCSWHAENDGMSVNFLIGGEAEAAVVTVEPMCRQTCQGCSVRCSSGGSAHYPPCSPESSRRDAPGYRPSPGADTVFLQPARPRGPSVSALSLAASQKMLEAPSRVLLPPPPSPPVSSPPSPSPPISLFPRGRLSGREDGKGSTRTNLSLEAKPGTLWVPLCHRCSMYIAMIVELELI